MLRITSAALFGADAVADDGLPRQSLDTSLHTARQMIAVRL